MSVGGRYRQISLPHMARFSCWMVVVVVEGREVELHGAVDGAIRPRGKDICGGRHPVGTGYLPPDC